MKSHYSSLLPEQPLMTCQFRRLLNPRPQSFVTITHSSPWRLNVIAGKGRCVYYISHYMCHKSPFLTSHSWSGVLRSEYGPWPPVTWPQSTTVRSQCCNNRDQIQWRSLKIKIKSRIKIKIKEKNEKKKGLKIFPLTFQYWLNFTFKPGAFYTFKNYFILFHLIFFLHLSYFFAFLVPLREEMSRINAFQATNFRTGPVWFTSPPSWFIKKSQQRWFTEM